MKKINLTARTGSCEIVFDLPYPEFPSLFTADKWVIITDANVNALYGKHLTGGEVIEIQPGEANKIPATVETLYHRFLKLELDRGSFVVGFGGGVVCDIAGFAASTYLRGLPFGFVPTTLLAQVDAAVGGKNGVNLEAYKNLVGVFQQPRFVLQDPDLLTTLPREELAHGLAEMIKYAAIGDAALFAFLEERIDDVLALDRDVLTKVIADAVRVKVRVVEADEREEGERRLLNFGHTFGHAVEKTAHKPHGEAVSIGMAVAGELSAARGLLTPADLARLIALLNRAGLSTQQEMNKEAVIDALRKDKKRTGETVRFVLLEGIGRAVIAEIGLDELA
ncbi:MAG: 3-dehydroquinate synthase, partial [Alphaproteobacteria bacterium]